MIGPLFCSTVRTPRPRIRARPTNILKKSPNMKKTFVLLLGAALLGSCTVQQKLTYTESSTRNVEPHASALIAPIVADLELVSETKIAPYEKIVPGEVTPQLIARIDGWKKLALSEAAQKYDADLLIGATITVDTVDGRLVIVVSGWPARYVNFRHATADDAWMTSFHQVTGGESALTNLASGRVLK